MRETSAGILEKTSYIGIYDPASTKVSKALYQGNRRRDMGLLFGVQVLEVIFQLRRVRHSASGLTVVKLLCFFFFNIMFADCDLCSKPHLVDVYLFCLYGIPSILNTSFYEDFYTRSILFDVSTSICSFDLRYCL